MKEPIAMKEISLGALEQFGKYGGLVGLLVCALIAIVMAMFVFLVWFIRQDRENKDKHQAHSSAQYEKRLKEEAHLANSVAEIALSVNALTMAIRTIPCMEKHKNIERLDDELFARKVEHQYGHLLYPKQASNE